MKELRFLFLWLALVLCFASYSRGADSIVLYVWDFSGEGDMGQFTDSLADYFEEALINSGCCTVLQRRDFARIFKHRQNEIAVMSISGLDEQTLEESASLNADAVVFGKLSNDHASGQVFLSITVERFNGEILERREIHIPRYEIYDPDKRRKIIAETVRALDFVKNSSKQRSPTQTRPSKPAAVKQKYEFRDVSFELEGCSRTGSSVTCTIFLRSLLQDRLIALAAAGDRSRASIRDNRIDVTSMYSQGYKYEADDLTIAGLRTPVNGQLETVLVAGIKIKTIVNFHSVPLALKSIDLLDLRGYLDGSFYMRFVNIPIE